METLWVCQAVFYASSLTLRRAALASILSCVEGWWILGDREAQCRHDQRFVESQSILEVLMDVNSVSEMLGGGGGGRAGGETELEVLVHTVLNEVIGPLQGEVDMHSRVLRLEIMRVAMLAQDMSIAQR